MSTAVLLSGGLDSAVLVAEEAGRLEGAARARSADDAAARPGVQPIYVSVGLAWEAAERTALAQFLASAAFPGQVRPLVSLAVDMRDVYPSAHWAIQGRPPGYHTPDEDVYLHGRNIVLLTKAAVYCAMAHIDRLSIGTLDHNPFPDATPEFRSALEAALSLGLAHALTIDAPYAHVAKSEVIRRGAALGLPLELTLSCMNPVDADTPGARPLSFPRHCGLCSKCRERHDAFLEAGVPDPTDYASRVFTT
jgi:7-cyano-7-deazaguanine synthase